ncbi:MAG: 3-deoxy-manno-octulosonate cytidylyltransferase [Bacteroidales bacterium]
MKSLGIIPARYDSSRLEGKPLADIMGKTMIQRVFEQAYKAMDYTCVATDDERIMKAVEAFGGRAVMTSKDHKSGTDRVAEAARVLAESVDFEVVVNIQGDEPFIEPSDLTKLAQLFNNNKVIIGTAVKRVENHEEINNPNNVKVVLDDFDNAIYFSRLPIPYVREKSQNSSYTYWKHIGLYAYRKEVLQELAQLKQSPLELAESLEQLRWIAQGYKISTFETIHDTIGVDTKEDLERAKEYARIHHL